MKYARKIRVAAFLLALLLVVGACPVTGYATEAELTDVIEVNTEVTETFPGAAGEMTEEEAEPQDSGAQTDDFSAPEIVYDESYGTYYNLISKNDYVLAPGITESEIVLNNDEGSHRQVAHVVEVDIHNPYTKVIPSYKGMIPKAGSYGVQVMSQQAAFAEANGYGNVVAAMNLSLSWYDSQYYKDHPELVGEPLGYMILDGVQYTNSNGQTSGAQTCLVINFDEKDGVARPDDIPKTEIRSTSSAITGWEEQVIPANFGFLVKNGVNQYKQDNNSANGASRSFVGIKADGSIVIVMNDGRQAPFSTGFTNYEMAEFMLSLGCVQAVNGDGGGSSAFLSQRPGEELKINCSPSDGAERETTHGVLVISTAPATGEFVRASISSEEDYYTPGSQVQFSAIGTDLVGTEADIPADVQWQLADDSFGAVDSDGLFDSNGTEGDVTVQMVLDGAVVGEDTIHIVMPDNLVFGQENMVVPYGKSVTLDLTATYDNKNVVLKEADVSFELSDDALGTIEGFTFTAAEEGAAVTSGTLTATVGDLSVSANLSLGKGSDIVYDFEDQNLEGWSIYTNYGKYGPVGPNGKVTKDDGTYWYHGQNERGYLSIVDETTGMVKNGEYALAVECDFTQIYETGYHALNLMFPTIDCTDSVAIGFWIYIPYDARHVQLGIGSGGFDNGQLFDLCEGWHYVTAHASNNKFYYVNISVDDRACSSTGDYYNYVTEANLNGKYTFYIDDITVDYSTAVDDREAPVFEKPQVLSVTGETSSELTGQTVSYNTFTFEAKVAENTEKTNAVGLDAASAKAYIDGKAVDCTYTGGKITVPNAVLADGVHTVRFEMSDKMGNMSWVGGDINVQTGTEASTVRVVPQDPEADRILIGSLYWMDVVATDIETVDKVEMVFDLNNASSWELEGMTVAEGFTAEWSVREDDNIASITITRTGENNAAGEAVLASFPVRTWESSITEYEGYEDQTPAVLVSRGIIWKKSIELDLQLGVITYVADYDCATTGTFGMEDLLVETEIFFTNYTRKSVTGAQEQINAWVAAGTGWHEHTVEAVADREATCTADGFTGRTYCAVCDSVVDWGTSVPAAGHSYQVSGDGLYTCGECGQTHYYVGGELQKGWQELNGSVYYFDGNGSAVDGENEIDGITYTFSGKVLTAPALVSDGVALIGWWAGEQMGAGWHTLNGNKYFVTGIYVNTGISKVALNTNLGYRWYAFDANGVWQENHNGLFDDGDEIIYCEKGVAIYAGLVQDAEGNYYYINSTFKAVRSCTYGIGEAKTNGLLPAGVYEFGADARMIDPPIAEPEDPEDPEQPEVKQGLIQDEDGEIRYYVDGVATYAGLVQDAEGNYYYINSTFKAVRSCTYGIGAAKTNGLLPAGIYEFGADCKMIDPPTAEPEDPEQPEVKQGLVRDEDGEIRYYVDGVAIYAGLVRDDEGNYYYINSTKKAVRSCSYGIGAAKTNGLLPAGVYEFGADCKMIIPEEPKVKQGLVQDEDGEIRYYVDGVATYAGLVQDDEGNYYYINSTKKAVRSCSYGIGAAKTNGLLPAGVYEFGADCKMILD